MYPVFIKDKKIAVPTTIYSFGTHMQLGFQSMLTPWGLFFPLEEHSFQIIDFLKYGWRNINSKYDSIEGMILTSRGELKRITLHQCSKFFNEKVPEAMITMIKEPKETIYRSREKGIWYIDEISIPYSDGFQYVYSPRNRSLGLAETAMEIAEGNIEEAVEAFAKGFPFGPMSYRVFEIQDAVAWMKENRPSIVVPWSWTRVPPK